MRGSIALAALLRGGFALAVLTLVFAATPARAQLGAGEQVAQQAAELAASGELQAMVLPVNVSPTLFEQLAQPVSFDFADTPLEEVAASLEQSQQLSVLIDTRALEDYARPTNPPLTAHAESQPLAAALTSLLKEQQLSWTLHEDTLLITVPDEVANQPIMCVYPVADLVESGASVSWPRQRTKSYDDLLADMIYSSVDPQNWDIVGGASSLAYFPASQALVVTGTPQAHFEILELLATLRTARQMALGDAAPYPDPDGLVLRIYRLTPPINTTAYQELLEEETAESADREAAPAESTPSGTYATQLGEALEAMLEPASWSAQGGPGDWRSVGNTLFIRQTPAVQLEIEKLLNELEPPTFEFPETNMPGGFGGGLPASGSGLPSSGGIFSVPAEDNSPSRGP